MITPLEQGQRAAVKALLSACISPTTFQLDDAMWRWSYDANPVAPDAPRVLVFPDEDEVLGVLGMIPVRLQAGQGEVDAAWGIDVFVAPEFQNAGIGGMLVEAWDRATPVSLSLGVTDMAFEVFLASGRVHVGDVPVYKRLLTPSKVLEKRLGSRWVAAAAGKLLEWKTRAGLPRPERREDLGWEPLRSFDAGFDALWARAARGLGFAVRRSADWLRWRFEAYPRGGFAAWRVLERGELAGFAVTHQREHDGLSIGYVADVLCADRGAPLEFALARAVDELRERGADVVECLASHPDLQAALERVGFLARPSKTRLLYKVNRPELEPRFEGAGELARWHVTLADSDDLTVLLNEA